MSSNISGITGFSGEEAHSICDFMKLALDLPKCESQMVNAAVVVDPSTKEVIASASDQVHACSCSVNHEATTSSSLGYRPQNHENMLLNSSATQPQVLYDWVSCLNPWQWSNLKSCDDSCSWHPLRHAAIVAIEYSAARDRHLFPGSGNDFAATNHVDPTLTCHSSKKQRTKSMHVCDGTCSSKSYPKAGALGSVRRLQGEKSSNHHYAVFKVLLPEKSLDRGGISLVSKSIDSDNIESPSNVAL